MSYTQKSWSETKAELRECFGRWGVQYWDIECETTQYSRYVSDDARKVLVWYVHPESGEEKRLETAQYERPMDNLRAIYLTLDGIRLAEKRGLGELMKQNYAALPAPKERTPWEVLGVQPNAAPEVVEASYRALAKKAHPDAGGRAEDFRELQEAYEAMRR
jgi:hypothetical protein